MQRLRSADELGEQWSLRPENALLAGMVDDGKLGLAALLTFRCQHGLLPNDDAD